MAANGPLPGVVSLDGATAITFACNPGNDILTEISLACETRNRTLVSIIRMNGIVIRPSLIYGNNQIRTHEGACTLLSMSMIAYPLGNNGGCTISIVGADGIPYGGRVAGPLIAASQIIGVLLVKPPVEDSDDEAGSCLTSD